MIDHSDAMWRVAEIDRRTTDAVHHKHNYPSPLAYPCHDAVTNLTDPRPTTRARILRYVPPSRY